MRNGRDYSRMNDPANNRAFQRGYRWRTDDYSDLPAVVAQAQRDLEARRRLCIPIPRMGSAAPFEHGGVA